MTELVGYMALFIAVAVFFVFIQLVAGRFIRPVKPDPEKLTIYECGEPTIGSSWIQFDLRFYVVALLFVIFDVEVAFFFPWAVVFGKATALAQQNLPEGSRLAISRQLVTEGSGSLVATDPPPTTKLVTPEDARRLAWIAAGDIAVFFGVLLVGFAYLWRRGDLDWVRSIAAEKVASAETQPLAEQPAAGALVGAGRG